MDKLTQEQRSANMRRIGSKNTKPEWIVRRLVHRLGFRYRLHVKSLPGKPDLVFPCRRCVIQVHGCFWHLHEGCTEGRIPSSREDYWVGKLKSNQDRDAASMKALRKLGWRVLVVWECQVLDLKRLEKRLTRFIESGH